MQRLEVSGSVRPIYGSLGVKRLMDMYFRMQRRNVKQNWAYQKNKSTQQPDFEWKYFGR